VVVEGEFSVTVGDTEARKLGTGDYLGEMALIDRHPRSETVTALTDVRCLVFTQRAFRPFALGHPQVAWHSSR
jgi:CRP-like cAMP-binding protein